MHKDSLAAFYKAYGFLAPNCCPTATPGSPYPSLMPPPIALDKTGAYPSIYPPTPPATAAAALAAYNYSQRVKGMMPATGAVSNPHCRDPYCAGQCGPLQHNSQHHPLALVALASSSASSTSTTPPSAAATGTNHRVDTNGHSSSQVVASNGTSSAVGNNSTQSSSNTPCTPATCPNGCNQCEHQRYLATLAAVYGNSFAALGNGYGVLQSPSAAAAASNAYASSLAAAAALQQHHQRQQ